ncbi:MAG: fucose permease [Puniceicoccaceae bacterium 5H]|nr:MAG: fucose permease [Puniceicoccaceae bacterium 5H]
MVALFGADGIGFGVWAGLIPHFQQQLGFTTPQLGIPLLALVCGAIISMPLAGSFSARRGSMTLGGPACFAFASALCLVAGTAAIGHGVLFTLAAFLFGATKGLIDVSANTQAVLLEEARQRPLNAFCQACWSLGGLTGSSLVAVVGREEAFITPLLIVVAGAIAAIGVFAPRRLVDDRNPEQKAGGGTSTGVFSALRDSPHLRILGALAILSLFTEGVMSDWAAVYLREAGGASNSFAALGYTAVALAMTTGRFSGDWAIRKLGPANVLRLGGSMVALGILLAVGTGLTIGHPAGIMGGFVLLGLGVANLVPVIFSAAGKDPIAGAGPGIATVTTLGFGGFLIGPPLIAAISAGIGLSGALLILLLAGGVIAWNAQRAVRV